MLETGKSINGKVVITSSVHGDEITGVLLIKNLLADLKKLSTKLGVQISITPFVNLDGIKETLREDPVSKKDLNRCFFKRNPPKQVRKLKSLLSGASFVIDIHCFPHTKHALTGLLFTSESNKEISRINRNAVTAFNPDICWSLDFKDLDKEKKGSMGEWLVENDIPGIAIETDSPEFLNNEDVVDISKKIICTVEVALGKSISRNNNISSLKRFVVKAEQSGIFIPLVQPLQHISKDQKIGKLISFDLSKVNVSSSVSGRVVFSKVAKFVNKDEKLVGIGIK